MSLRLGEIDLKKKPIKPQIFLCKPNKDGIAKLSESYDVRFNVRIGSLNEVRLKLPVFLDRKHKLVRNENVDVLRGRYLLRVILGTHEEYFIITKVEKVDGRDEYVEITALSLAYELNDKIIRDYEGISKTATELLNDVLVDTIWSVGYVDSEFDLKRRGLEVSSNSVQELVVEISETFNASIVWDTINRTVNFYRPENIGENKGFNINYDKYLEGLNQEDNSEDVITRLKLYGKEDLTIREVNITGTTYIEDFSYYMYPFKRDENRNVIEQSEYMSDELCHAILDYNDLLKEYESAFSVLVEKKRVFSSDLSTKEYELFNFETEMKILLDQRDILNTRIAKLEDDWNRADNQYSPKEMIEQNLRELRKELQDKLMEIVEKEAQIQQKENEIVIARQDLNGVDQEILELKEIISIENNFTPELIAERNQYIVEREWQDNNITDAEDLLKEGLLIFNDFKREKITVKIDVVNFLGMVTEQRDWDKLNLGDIVTINHERLDVAYQAKIIEIDYDFEKDSIEITISNVKDLETNKSEYVKMINEAYNSSTQVKIDRWKWDLSLENNGAINEIINSKWDANRQAIVGAKDQVVEISDRGLIIRDPNDPNNYLVGLNSMIAITNDGGQTWKHAITSEGIVGERIYGKVIMGVNLAIEDESGILKFQGSRGQIFDRNGDLVMKLGLVSEPPETTGECFGMIALNEITRVKVTDCEGFAIERANSDYPNGWEKVFWADQSSGTVYAYDLVAQNIKLTNNVGDLILDAETNYFNLGKFEEIVADNKLTTLEKLQLASELNKIHSNYKLLLGQAKKYQRSKRDDVFDPNAQFFTSTPSNIDLFSLDPVINAYSNLINYMKSYLMIVDDGIEEGETLYIDINDPLTELTQEILPDRATFILMFKNYYDEAERIRQRIEDTLYYGGIYMGEYYNNITIGEYGFIALRNDGRYRAYLNATNGLALQKWENGMWVNKIYANTEGTLVAEDMITRRLRIVDANLGERITFDQYEGITIYGYNGEVIKLNANEAISIYTNGDRKFWVGTDGRLYAKDITTHGLRIVDGILGEKIILDQDTGITINGNNGEQIRLNANEGIAIDVNGDPRFWVHKDGTLRARRLIVVPENDDDLVELPDGSFISDLTVKRLRSLNSKSPQDYILIEDNYLKIFTGNGSENDIQKFSLTTKDTTGIYNGFPYSEWGNGDGVGDNNKGFIFKDNIGFYFHYKGENGLTRKLSMSTSMTDSILLESPHKIRVNGKEEVKIEVDAQNYILINSSGVTIKGRAINLN